MDSQGWVDVSMIASFNRVRSLTTDLTLVREVMAMSVILELASDGEKCRMSNNTWEHWLLAPGSADPQTHTPQFQYQPQQPIGADPSQEHFITVDSGNSSGEGASMAAGGQENTSTESVIIIS